MSGQTVVLVVTAVILCSDAVQAKMHTQNIEEYRSLRSASESTRKCKTHAECQHNAFCSKMDVEDQGFCLCQEHSVLFEKWCLPAATEPGDKCSKSIQCTKKIGDKADCLNGECKCIPGSHFMEGTCHKFVKIGQKCAGPNDCYSASGTPVSCKEGVCQCLEGYYPNGDRSDCVLRIKLGEKCSRPDECVANYSTCTNTCTCLNGFTPSSDKQRCLPLINELNKECEEEAQCTKKLLNTACRRRKCACKSGTKFHGGTCVESKGLGTFCDSDALCRTEKSECSQDICACKKGWVAAADNTRCIQVADDFNAKCEEVRQCTFGDNAECKEGKCVCRPDYFFTEMKCLKNKVLGSPCVLSIECHIAEDGKCQRMECKSGQCACKQGFEPDPNNQRCSGVSPGGAGGVSLAAAMCSLLFLMVAQIVAV